MVDDVGPHTRQRVGVCLPEPFEACAGQCRCHAAGVLGGLFTLDQVFNQHSPARAADFVTSDVVWHGGSLGDIAGAGSLAGLLESFLGALPDLYAAEQDIVAENDLVLVRLVVTATVKGSLLGVPADGKPVRWTAYDVYRVTDGKISEEWAGDDIATIMTQIGAFSPPWTA